MGSRNFGTLASGTELWGLLQECSDSCFPGELLVLVVWNGLCFPRVPTKKVLWCWVLQTKKVSLSIRETWRTVRRYGAGWFLLVSLITSSLSYRLDARHKECNSKGLCPVKHGIPRLDWCFLSWPLILMCQGSRESLHLAARGGYYVLLHSVSRSETASSTDRFKVKTSPSKQIVAEWVGNVPVTIF